MTPEQTIKRPLVLTEKGSSSARRRTSTSSRSPEANKAQIRDAVETLFDVTVTEVNTMLVRGRIRTDGPRLLPRRRTGRRRSCTWQPARHRLLRGGRGPWVSRIQADTAVAPLLPCSDFSDIANKAPERALTEPKKRRPAQQPGPHHRPLPRRRTQAALSRHRLQAQQVRRPGEGRSIEYDPNRSARIALLHYADGEKRYILGPDGLKAGRRRVVEPRRPTSSPATASPLQDIPAGTLIHNIELKRGKGAQLVRSAGIAAQLMAKDGDYAQVKLPSGEVRRIHVLCRATIGQVSNVEHAEHQLGKAGRTRWLGRRPHNRGVTMNPVDHPMGGGEGRTTGGRHPCSPWGKLAKGMKTRNNKRTDHASSKKSEGEEKPWRVSPKRARSSTTTCSRRSRMPSRAGSQEVIKTWSRRSTILPEAGRPHLRRAQRAEVRARVRHREHGRATSSASSRPPGRSTGTRPTRSRKGKR